MTASLLDRLAARLRSAPVAITEATPIAVALSGGVDSITLLSALRRIGIYRDLRCIHVNHGLHSDAADWTQFCREFAGTLGLEFVSRDVEVVVRDKGVEAAARDARYAAFADELREGEVLLTAHHADDQLETLVYRLLRGTGVDGLRGIREFEPFGRGFLMRPLLSASRADILEEAGAAGLQWCEDPSNADARFDRNFLRQVVLPSVLERWPQAGKAAARLAAAAADAAAIGAEIAAADVAGVAANDCLSVDLLAALSLARRRNVLRYALRELALPIPDSACLERICALSAPGAAAAVQWPGAEAHCFGGAIYLRAARPPLPVGELRLLPGHTCAVAEGQLVLERAPAPALPDAWVSDGLVVRFRAGRERFHSFGDAHPQLLREWMRTKALLPWMRDRIPLLYRDTQLVAIADLSVCDAAVTQAGPAGGWRVAWQERPRTS